MVNALVKMHITHLVLVETLVMENPPHWNTLGHDDGQMSLSKCT
jgi:hypothetical protein